MHINREYLVYIFVFILFISTLYWSSTTALSCSETRKEVNRGSINVNNNEKNTFYYFLHITDLHLGSGSADTSYLESFANLVKNVYTKLPIKPLAVIDTGDIADDPEYVWLYDVYSYYDSTLDLSGTGIIRLDTIGNHDDRINSWGNGNIYYREHFGSPTYKYDIYVNATHYVRFIAINTTKPNQANGYVNSTLLDWLEDKIIEAENDPNCIGIWVFGHHPPAPNSNENVSAGGWDYKVTPFNSITSGDPWRLVRIIASYKKVLGYVYGHVHENWVSTNYGKYWITTAPLTLRGPWSSSSSRWFNGEGYVYRIVTYYNGVVNTYVYKPTQKIIGFIINIRQGEILSGLVDIVVFAASNNPISKVELYIDDKYYGDLQPLNITSNGGLYHIIVNITRLSDWQHYFNIHIIDDTDTDYWSPRHYFYARIAGGVLFARSDLAMYSMDMRENYPVARLYIYSDASEDFPFIALYVPVNTSSGEIRVKTLLDTEHIPYNMHMRFSLVAWKEAPSPNDKNWNNAAGMMKLVAGASIEKNDAYPYDTNLWRQKGDPSQWWGDYQYLDSWWPAVGYWLQVTYTLDSFTVEKWLENETYQGPHYISGSWTYYSDEYSYQYIRYVGLLVRSDTGYYSQVAIAYLEVDDGKGIRKYNFAPNIIGIPVKALIQEISINDNKTNISVIVETINYTAELSGKLVLQGSNDELHWNTITEHIFTNNTVYKYVFSNQPYYNYYRVIYVPASNVNYPLATSYSQPVSAISSPQPVPEPRIIILLGITLAVIVSIIYYLRDIRKS